ncbi:MAG: branched-chain amino acid ABC transporter permease [Desulfatiglans sp.]|nr:branched-chain amino acid ABC transporter permease [Desulfatiglans sp.]
MYFFIQLVISGLVLGGVYALIALAIVVIYKTTQVFNFAQGALMLIGAYFCWSLSVQFGIPMVAGIALTLVFSVLLGLFVTKTFVEPLIGQPIISAVMMTLVLSLLMENVVNLLWGGPAGAYPQLFPDEPIMFGEFVISSQHLIILVFIFIIFGLMVGLFKYSNWGLQMRTVAEDHQAARSCGLNVKTVFGLCWAIAAVLAAISGVLQASISGVDASLISFGLKGFAAVLVGGLESVGGAIIGGLLIGVLENLTGGYLGSFGGGGVKEVIPYIILIVILIFRPHGLFGLHRIERI